MASDKRSVFDTIDNLLLVGIAIVVALVLFGIVGAIVHTILFLVKVLVLAVLVGIVFTFLSRRR